MHSCLPSSPRFLRLFRNSCQPALSSFIPYPSKSKSVVVIGAGVSGLACAIKLLLHKYPVTIYEKTERLGGQLWGPLPPEDFLPELERNMRHEGLSVRLSTCVCDLSQIPADAIYIATGKGGNDFGMAASVYPSSTSTEESGIFIGGSVLGADVMNALAGGIRASLEIEAYFKTNKMNNALPFNNREISYIDPMLMAKMPPVVPENSEAFSPEEASIEASRCLKCDCDICMRRGALMGYYKKHAKRVAEDIHGTLYPADMFSNHIATRMVASCDQCGLCKQDCPQAIDMQALILDARRIMVTRGEIPPPYSAFWLNDMCHANGKSAHFVRATPNSKKCKYAFSPGCQLGASDPRYVSGTYKRLLEKNSDTGLMVGCCGEPAYWAGHVETHMQAVDIIRSEWESIGKPTLIFACPTCKKMFAEQLCEILSVSLYEMELGGPTGVNIGKNASVYDPCSSRTDIYTQKRVRELLIRAGYELWPLKYEKENALCCSWGGQYELANPNMAKKVVSDRVGLSSHLFVTYCTNCRDTFARAGKPTLHILDVLLGINDPNRESPTWTHRRKTGRGYAVNCFGAYGRKMIMEP